MPLYEYIACEGETGCDHCRPGFAITQSMKEDALSLCPKCGARIERAIFPVGIATPKTPSELKNLGFKKLVRRDKGVYENLTATGNESRIWDSTKPSSAPDIKSVISD